MSSSPLEPSVQGSGAFLQVHGEGDTLVLRSDPLGQSLELVGFFLRDAEVIMPAHKEHGLVDGQGRATAIGQSPADRSIGFLGPAPQLDLVLPCPRHVDQPIAVLQYAPTDLPLLVDEDVKPFGGGQFGRVLVLGSDYDALFLVRQVLDPVPPRIEALAHFGHHFGMLANDVLLLQGIGGQVVQFAVLEQTPAFPKDRCLIGPHLGLGVRRWIIREAGHPAVVNDEDTVVRYLLLAPENGSQTHAVELGSFSWA